MVAGTTAGFAEYVTLETLVKKDDKTVTPTKEKKTVSTDTTKVIELPKYRYKFGDINIYNTCIFIIGVGGTGGFVARDLLRFMAAKKKNLKNKIDIYLIDPDKVEEKNLVRQNFIEEDLGCYKAEVLAERYSAAYGVEAMAICEAFDKDTWTKLTAKDPRLPIFIGCLDNNKARREIHKCICASDNHIAWIDAGNESDGGQVVLGSCGNRGSNVHIPFVTELYPEILDATKDPVDTVSCAERVNQDIQNIFVNLNAANYIMNFMNVIYSKKETAVHGIQFNILGVTTPLLLPKTQKFTDMSAKRPWHELKITEAIEKQPETTTTTTKV